MMGKKPMPPKPGMGRSMGKPAAAPMAAPIPGIKQLADPAVMKHGGIKSAAPASAPPAAPKGGNPFKSDRGDFKMK